jgi:hypothetical protein
MGVENYNVPRFGIAKDYNYEWTYLKNICDFGSENNADSAKKCQINAIATSRDKEITAYFALSLTYSK